MASERETCPSCASSYYPRWNAVDCNVSTPDRTTTITAGKIYIATCTSCDELLLKFDPNLNQAEPNLKSFPIGQVWPIPEQTVIEIVVRIIIEFEDVRRREEGKEERSEQEKEERSDYLSNIFSGMWEAVSKGAGAARVIGQLTDLFTQRGQLTSEAEE